MAEKEPEKFVVVTKANADDKDYARAVVCTDEESANEYLAEVKAATPWQTHESVKLDKFNKDSEKAVKASSGKDEH